LVCFDQVLGLPPRAIDLVVERLGQARQIGDDEAAVGTLSPGLDARDDAALGIPAFGCVTEIAVASDLLRFARDAAQGGVLRERADPGDCQEFRARLSGLTDQPMAAVKRSPKRTANCDLAMDHSRGGMIHSFSDRFKTRKRSLVAASSVGKWPLALTARRSLAFSASMAFVVYKIRRTSPGKA